MEVSFLLSADELFTLMSIISEKSEAGQYFIDSTLEGAELCDLSTLTEKNLARYIEDELEIEPVLNMMTDALTHAESAELKDDVWTIRSPYITLKCQKYPFHEGHWKITPVKERESK